MTTATVRRRKPVWPWLVVLIPASLIGLVVVLGGLSYLFVASGEVEEMSSSERELLVNLEYLSEWFAGDPPPVAGKYTKTRYFDDTYDLDYELDSEHHAAPYISHSITFERKSSDAVAVYLPMWSTSMLAMRMATEQEITVDERNDEFSWGDQSRFGVLSADGQPFANAFVARSGKSVVFLVIAGPYFETGADFADMLEPKLELLTSHTPRF